MQRQAEAGIDVIDDGEMGKPNWITYLYERVSGLEPRMVPLEGGVILPPSRDRQAFPEFYAEHDAEFARAMANMLRLAERDREAASADEIEAEGKLLVLHRADRVRRRRARAGHRAPEGCARRASTSPTSSSRSSRPRASTGSATSTTRREEEFVFALADALHEEYKGIVDAGFLLQVDDAVLLHEYDSILSLGGSVEDYRRWAELRVDALVHALCGDPGGPDPLPRLLRELARPARLRPAARAT